MMTLFTASYFIIRRGLGGGGFGEEGDEGERLLDFIGRAWAVGLEISQGCLSVLPSVGEPTGLLERDSHVVSGYRSAVEIALFFLEAGRLLAVVQSIVKVGGGAANPAQLVVDRS